VYAKCWQAVYLPGNLLTRALPQIPAMSQLQGSSCIQSAAHPPTPALSEPCRRAVLYSNTQSALQTHPCRHIHPRLRQGCPRGPRLSCPGWKGSA
jgi:hypothetical protein